MPQRVLLAHAFALPIGLFALLFSQASCSSRAQGTLPQLTVLQSTRSFRLNTNLPRLEDAAVGSNGNLYFLMSEKGQHFEVIRVDDSGNTIQSVVVPPVNSAFRKIVAGPNGKLAVLLQQGSHSPDTIQVVDGDTGQLLNTISSSEKVSELCFLGPQLVGVASATSRLVPITEGAVPLNAPVLSDPIRIAAIDDQRIAVVQMVSGQLEVVGRTAAVVSPAKLVAPEIQGVERPQIPPSEGWVAQVQSLAATNTDIFVAPTGGKRQEGAPVLRFDTNGVLRQRYRCVLPTFGQDPSQHMSYMFAGKLLASQTSLFWISQSEHKVAEYILPPN